MLVPDPRLERAFFDIFADYYDLERRPNRRYGTGEYRPERMRPLADLAGRPENALDIVHVAGTKGKGTTAFFLAAMLESAEQSAGVFSSPHFRSVRERFRFGTQFVPYDFLLDASRRLAALIKKNALQPTLFEIMTILALILFREHGCRWAILETGIGGLLDATNFVERKRLTVITPISFDHMELLGDDISAIAGQKAGIIRRGVPVVCAPQPFREAERVIRESAAAAGSPYVGVANAGPLPRPLRTPPLPPFLRSNVRTALTCCRVLGVRPCWSRFRRPYLPGRFEILRRRPPVVVDGAHNADSARRLAAALQEFFPGVRFVTVAGVAPGKDAEGILRELQAVTDTFILTNPLSPRGSDLDALTAAAGRLHLDVRIVPEIRSVHDLPAERPLLFTGSFFTALIGDRLFRPGPAGGMCRQSQGRALTPRYPG